MEESNKNHINPEKNSSSGQSSTPTPGNDSPTPDSDKRSETSSDQTVEQVFGNRTDLTELSQAVENIRGEIGRKLIGQFQMVDLIIAAILSDGHVLIEGVPGVAKTFTSKLISRVLSADFKRIQFTPDLMPSDVTGTNIFNQKHNDFEFIKGPIFSNIILIDEINRAPAKTQAALFECMEEKQVTVDRQTYILDFPFIVLATQNPVEHEGTYRLPEAQLDRFLFKIDVDYPSTEQETMILEGISNQTISKDISDITSILTKEQIQKFRDLVKKVRIEKNLIKYIAKIIESTRNNSSLYLGASPRASIGILQSSKAIAAMHGRDFVTPEDIREVTYPVLSHRIIPTPEKEMEGVSTKDIIKEILEKIEIPR